VAADDPNDDQGARTGLVNLEPLAKFRAARKARSWMRTTIMNAMTSTPAQ